MRDTDRYSVLLEPGESIGIKDLDDWLEEKPLEDHLSLWGAPRALTPLIGYGMLQVDANDRIPWDSAFDTTVESLYSADSEELGFLDNVIRSRIGDKERIPDDSFPPQLSDARVAVFELAFRATKVFVQSWNGHVRSVTNWTKHSIPLGEDSNAELMQAITDAVTAIDAIPRSVEEASKTNGEVDLLGGAALSRRLSRIRSELKESGRLHGTAVEYCTQAFWHVMTFDAPLYPRYDELAFQVSLCLGSSSDYPHLRAAPPTSVQRTAFPGLSDCVARSVGRGFRYDRREQSERDRLYEAFAQTMHASYDYFADDARAPHQFATEQEQQDRKEVDQSHSIILTTNFDLELERALAATKSGDHHYHVAMPVFVNAHEAATVSQRASLRWIVGAFATVDEAGDAPDEARLRMRVSDTEFGGWQWFENLRPSGLKGPLVIKLSGSPCHHVPSLLHEEKGLSQGGANAKVHHATLLDEIDFIQAVQADAAIFVNTFNPMWEHGSNKGVPEWVYNSLRSRTRLWLLCGTRLADWTLRLHLFMQLSRLTSPEGAVFFDIAKDVGDDRAHLLRWLGVSPLRGDCKDLVAPLTTVAKKMEGQQ